MRIINNKVGLLMLIFMLTSTVSQPVAARTLPDAIKRLGGNIILVKSYWDQENQWHRCLYEYQVATDKVTPLLAGMDYEYPQNMPGGREILCMDSQCRVIVVFDGKRRQTLYKSPEEICFNFTYAAEQLIYLGEFTPRKETNRNQPGNEAERFGMKRVALKDQSTAWLETGQLDFNLRMRIFGIKHQKEFYFSALTAHEHNKKFSIYRLGYQDNNWKTPEYVCEGNYPLPREDGKYLATISNHQRELVIYDLKQKKYRRMGLKEVTDLAWINSTDYLIYKKWASFLWYDELELGIINTTTKQKYKLLTAPRGGFGPGLAWMNR